MKVSLAELILLISRTSNEVYEKKNAIFKNTVITSDVELTGVETILNNVENFNELYNEYINSLEKLEKYKNTLALANCTRKIVDGDLTITEALNKVIILRRQLEVYENLLLKKETKERRFDGNGSTSYYRVNSLNFSVTEMEKLKSETAAKIDKLESLITATNTSTFVEI